MDRKKTRAWDIPSALLLAFMLLTVAQRLYATGWATGLGMALVLTILGLLLGMALGSSRFAWWGVTCLAIGYSLAAIPLVTGVVLAPGKPWLERMTGFVDRLGISLRLFFSNQEVTDTLLFVLAISIVCWIVSLLAGYSLTRWRSAGGAILPAGIMLFIIQLYDQAESGRSSVMAVFTFLGLLLAGRLFFLKRRQAWVQNRVTFSSESWTDLNITLAVTSLVVVMAAWLVPANQSQLSALKQAWDTITSPLQRVQENLQNAVAGVNEAESQQASEFFGETMDLGLNATSGEAVSLQVMAPLIKKADRYYWRVRTYDVYQANKWETSFATSKPLLPDSPLLNLAGMQGLASEFTFTDPRSNLAVLVTPAHPVWINRASRMIFAPAAEQSIDPLMFQADPVVKAGQPYKVQAVIIKPTVDQLLKAGHLYPRWVQDHYLQLPGDISPRVTALAKQLTRDLDSPYEKAVTITEYLRSGIQYTRIMEAPPAGKNPLEWFLFDSKTGFCNYYATAEVILLRAAGVPTRMVVGFAEGTFEYPDLYTILEKDAHAWPEVFFPGVGWVEFEPTSSQPALARDVRGEQANSQQEKDILAGNSQATREPGVNEPGPGLTGKYKRPPGYSFMFLLFGTMMLIIVGVIVAYATGLLARDRSQSQQERQNRLIILVVQSFASLSIPAPGWLKRWEANLAMTPVERSFQVIFQGLRQLGRQPLASDTPAEAAGALIQELPGVKDEVRLLLNEYHQVVYSQTASASMAAHGAEQVIRIQVRNTARRRKFERLGNSWRGIFSRKKRQEPTTQDEETSGR